MTGCERPPNTLKSSSMTRPCAAVRETNLSRADLRRASLDRVDLASATLKETRIDLSAAVMLAELHGAVVDLDE